MAGLPRRERRVPKAAVETDLGPKGQTPVIVHPFNWKKMSISAALAYRWDGKRARLYFQMKPDSYEGTSLIGFLKDLKKHFRRQPVLLIWDGLPAHRGREMQEFRVLAASVHEKGLW